MGTLDLLLGKTGGISPKPKDDVPPTKYDKEITEPTVQPSATPTPVEAGKTPAATAPNVVTPDAWKAQSTATPAGEHYTMSSATPTNNANPVNGASPTNGQGSAVNEQGDAANGQGTTNEPPKTTKIQPKPMSFDEWYKTVPADRNNMRDYNLRRAFELADWDDLEAWRTADDLDTSEDHHLLTTYKNPDTGDYEFVVSKNHPLINTELNWYKNDKDGAPEFRRDYILDTSGDYYKYLRRNKDDASSDEDEPRHELTDELQAQYDKFKSNDNTPDGMTFTGKELEEKFGENPDSTSSGASPKSSSEEKSNVTPLTPFSRENLDKAIKALEEDGDEREWIERRNKAHEDFISAVTDYADSLPKPEDKYERAKREKREKRQRLFSAIGDGITALANLYYTSKGAPNMYDKDNSITKRVTEWQDKLKKDREADRDAWYKAQSGLYTTIGEAVKERREDKKNRVEQLLKAQKAEEDYRTAMERARVYHEQGNYYAEQVELAKARELKEQSLATLNEKKADSVVATTESNVEKNKSQTNLNNTKAEKLKQGGTGTITRSGTRGKASSRSGKAKKKKANPMGSSSTKTRKPNPMK